MTKIDLETIIPNILENVDFHNYLINEGYSIIKNTSNKIQQSYFKETISFNEIIYISLVDGKEKYFSASFGDSGNLITFVKNRIELDGTYDTFNPKKNNIIEACKKLLLYLNDSSIKNEKSKLTNIDPNSFKEFQKKTFTHFYEAEAIYYTNFLNKKGVSNDTIYDLSFVNKIFNTVGLYHKDKSYEVVNTAFPLYNINLKEVGLVNYNTISVRDNQEEDIILPVASSDLKKGFWISNVNKDHGTVKTRLTVVDTPIEALSHFEIFNNDRVYLSFFEKNEKAFEIILRLIENHNANLFLSSSVNIENIIFEFRLIIFILSKTHPVNFLIENNNHINLEIKTCPELKLFTERIQKFNNKLINGVLSSLGRKATTYLENEIIKGSKIGSDTLVFKIPKTLQVLYGVSKLLTSTFEIKTGLITEKSNKFNWEKLALNNKNKTFAELVKAAEVFGFKNINY